MENERKKLALEIIDRLKKEYPEAGCTLDYNEAWKLLVSVRLAAQCTDSRVNVVVEKSCMRNSPMWSPWPRRIPMRSRPS